MNSCNKLFRCEVIVKFREDWYVYVDKKIVVDDKTFKPIDKNKRKIKISFTIEAEDLDSAKIHGKSVAEQILAIMCLKTNVGAIVDDFDVFEISNIEPKVEEGNRSIVVRDVAKIKDEVFVGIRLEEKSLNEIIRFFNALERIKDDEREYILRMLYWYNKAVLEKDDINRFMLLWTALEVWKTYKFGSSIGGKHKEKMKTTLQRYGYEGNFDDIYDLRCDIFHEGVREGVKRHLPLLEQCIHRILDELKEYLVDNP